MVMFPMAVPVTMPNAAHVAHFIHGIDQEESETEDNLRVLLQSVPNFGQHVHQGRCQQNSSPEAQQKGNQRWKPLTVPLGTEQGQDSGHETAHTEGQYGEQLGFVSTHADFGEMFRGKILRHQGLLQATTG